MRAVDFDDVLAAARRLSGVAHKTPVMTSATLNRTLSCEVFFKCENLQRIGAFKFRGAYNAMSRLTETEKRRGVVTYSSGNHAQAVALVGRMLSVPVTVVMPEDAPALKLSATKGYGAEVLTYDPVTGSREAIAAALLEARGCVMIPPFDHPDVIAGQGTAALELTGQVGGLELLLVPCGGGGLLSGSAIAAKGRSPDCRVVGVEPELADDATRSFRTGTLHTVHNPPTIADGTRTASLGKFTFPLVLAHVDDMITVSEEAIREAVRFFFYRMKLVVEPSGALGLAGLMSGAVAPPARVGVIVSGGNIDGAAMAQILGKE
ncbi:MAG: threo-3-hydroxy-L-aspartate ammonia-lyase [Desulfobacterales bacterium]|jgi:threonine dehydratase